MTTTVLVLGEDCGSVGTLIWKSYPESLGGALLEANLEKEASLEVSEGLQVCTVTASVSLTSHFR